MPERIVPVEHITSLLAPVPGSQTEDESQRMCDSYSISQYDLLRMLFTVPRLPSTALAALVASKPKTAVVLAPDSESEDDSQPCMCLAFDLVTSLTSQNCSPPFTASI